jgi:hypothetical protein
VSLAGFIGCTNVPFKLRLKNKKKNRFAHFKKKASSMFIVRNVDLYKWDSLTSVNVPFKLRLKTKKMNKSLASKKKASFLF